MGKKSRAREANEAGVEDSSQAASALPAERKEIGRKEKEKRRRRLPVFCLTTLGIVYGDIGTSPLYAFRECFNPEDAPNRLAVTAPHVLGVLSLITWSLILVVTVKYILYVMRADNKGEGGILALLALMERKAGTKAWFVVLSVFGAALLYGDGMITPAISVLSAVEGLKLAHPIPQPVTLGLTAVILIGLFLFQKNGTKKVGLIFGPVMLLWFAVIGLLGALAIARQPAVLAALNPWHALVFVTQNGWLGFTVLGAVFLVVTGGEALYADLGHFGATPIRIAWFGVVLPGLLLNYFGQGALVLGNAAQVQHPFFHLAPKWALYPLIVLATAAAVIASQAVISGVFSLTRQAVLLDRFPRVQIDQTSHEEIGQVYVPALNWLLMVACVGLVFGFRTSSNLAGAYGVAVTTTMVITTLLAARIARTLWHWNALVVTLITAGFLVIDLAFFGANMIKFLRGGWFPILIGLLVFVIMTTWHRGHELLLERLRQMEKPLGPFLGNLTQHPPLRVTGTSVFLTGRSKEVPAVLLHHLRNNKVLSEDVLLLEIRLEPEPHIPRDARVESHGYAQGFRRVQASFGFMDMPDVPDALKSLPMEGEDLDLKDITYYVGRSLPKPSRRSAGMARWRKKLFIFLNHNSTASMTFLRIPPSQSVELGLEMEI